MIMRETEARTGRRQPFALRHRISAAQTVVVSIVAIVVIVASSVVAADGTVPGWEESVLLFFNDWFDWLEPLMWVLQQVGVTGAPIIAALVVYYFTRRWQHLVAFAAVLPMKLLIEKGLVKNLVERDRPFESVGPHINVRGPAFEGLSFPSRDIPRRSLPSASCCPPFCPRSGDQFRSCGPGSLGSPGSTTASTTFWMWLPERPPGRCSPSRCGSLC